MKTIKIGQKLILQHGDELGALSKALDCMPSRFQSIFKNIRPRGTHEAGMAQ
jgi:hypothetical protein